MKKKHLTLFRERGFGNEGPNSETGLMKRNRALRRHLSAHGLKVSMRVNAVVSKHFAGEIWITA